MNLTINQRCELAANYLCIMLKVAAPKRTGNLSINAINVVNDGDTWAVVVGGELAPYAVYTNEPWLNRPGVNPNQGWIETAIYKSFPILKQIFQGKYNPKEITRVNQEIRRNQNQFDKQIQARIAYIKQHGLYK